MTEEEIFVRKELEKVYPQLLINMKKICGVGYARWGEDLLPVAITFFLEKPLEQQLKTIREGKLENFITFIANMQLKSNSSYHYSHYRKASVSYRELFADYNYAIPENESEAKEEALQCVERELSKLDPAIKDAIIGIVFGERQIEKSASELNLTNLAFKKLLDKAVIQISERCQHCL